MKTLSRYVSLISVTGLLSGSALVAQTSGTSGTTGTSNDATRAGASTTPPRNSASSDVSGGTDTNSRGNDPSGPNRAATSGSSSSSARTSNNGYDTSATVGPSRTRNTFTGTAFSSDNDPLNSSIQSGNFSTRAQLASDIEQRLDSQKDGTKSLKNEGKQLQGQAKADFKAAYDELETHEKELKRSLKDVRSASQDKWETARSELASRYQAYTTALARVQAQVSTGIAFPNSSSASPSSSTSNRDRNATGSTPSGLTPSTSP